VRARPIPADIWAVGFLIVLAAAIRFATIATQSFWTDEALTAYEVQLPFGAMFHTVTHVETTPPLYFFLIWGWGKVLGTSEVALRSLSALGGCVLVPIAYLSARELVSRWAGVIAAAFVAFNPFLIWYSQEARAYMLLATLTGASFLWFLRARRDPSHRNLAWWALFSALGLMTHFFAGFVVAPEAVLLLWASRTRSVAVAVGAVAVVQAAMLPFALIDATHGVSWIALTPRYYRIGQVPLEFGVNTLYRSATTTEGVIGGSVLVAIVALLLALRGDRRSRRAAALAAGIGGFGILAPLLLGFVGQDYFLARYLIPVWLPLAIAIAVACAAPRARLAGGLLAAALIAMFVASTIKIQNDQFLQRPAWRELAHAIGAAPVPRAILAAGGSSSDPLRIYLPRVSWVQPQTRRVLIYEIDVIGMRKKQSLIVGGPSDAIAHGHKPPRTLGVGLPRSVAPRGTRLLARFSIDQWVVARFRFRHPRWIDLNHLVALAPRFFRRTPSALLGIIQPRGR
jgi:4-amino-4-deoxy-L-arabinose transferase-like glycosyltransferase